MSARSGPAAGSPNYTGDGDGDVGASWPEDLYEASYESCVAGMMEMVMKTIESGLSLANGVLYGGNGRQTKISAPTV